MLLNATNAKVGRQPILDRGLLQMKAMREELESLVGRQPILDRGLLLDALDVNRSAMLVSEDNQSSIGDYYSSTIDNTVFDVRNVGRKTTNPR